MRHGTPSGFRCSLLILLVIAMGSSLRAQNAVSTGTLSGTVRDPSGANVPRATVSILSQSTGIKQTSTTNESGIYTFPALPVGSYDVTIAAPGFKATLLNGVNVGVGQVVDGSAALALGQGSE